MFGITYYGDIRLYGKTRGKRYLKSTKILEKKKLARLLLLTHLQRLKRHIGPIPPVGK